MAKWFEKNKQGMNRQKVLFIFTLCFLFYFFSSSAFSYSNSKKEKHPESLSREIINQIEIHNQVPEKISDIQAVMRLKVGEVFNREKLENAIEDLRKWGVFKNVEVLVRHEGNKVDLDFQLEDAYLIKDVEIHGNFPLLEKKIKRAIFLSPGDIYDRKRIPEQVDRLLAFYEKAGYKGSTVFIEENLDEKNHVVTLEIHIQKGKDYRVGEVEVKGNTVFQDSRITNKVSRIFGYSPERLKQDIKNIQSLYRDENYPRARIKVADTQFDEKKRKVNFTLEIREGKEIEVFFEGNEHQWDKTLKKVIDIPKNGDTDDIELERAKAQLIQHYNSLGYDEVSITYKKQKLSDKKIAVTFLIQEGPKHTIKSIDFDGNKSFSEKKLREQMQTKEESFESPAPVFLENIFKQDLETITSFYEKNGFLEAKVTDWKKSLNATRDKYLIDIKLKENKQTFVESIHFQGLKAFSEKDLRKFLLIKEAGPYETPKLEQDVKALLIYYANHGYPYTEIKTELSHPSPEKVGVTYIIEEGISAKVGKILLVGNLLTKRSTILNGLRFKEGSIFNPQKILESQTTLRKLGIFDSLTIETLGLKGKESEIHTVVRVEEKKPVEIDLGFSYDTDTSFKAKMAYTRRNLFGMGKQFNLNLTGGPLYDRAEIDFTDPRFFGTDWKHLDSVYAMYESRTFFTDVQMGGSVGLFRELTKRLSMVIRYDLIRTDFLEEKTDFSELRPGTKDNTTGKLEYAITYDRRDNFGDPHSGFYTVGRVDFGTQFEGLDAHFFETGASFGYWWSPSPISRFTISNSFRFSTVIPFTKGAEIPTQELIFMGGDDTVRGFKQDAVNPAGGKVGLLYNLEFILRLFKGFQIAGFLDSGSVTNTFGEIGPSSFRHAAGPSIRYATPVGPLRVDYGFVLDPQPGEDTQRLHISFGYFF